MSQGLPATGYAILGLLTFGDELTGYEIKQRADVTLRFYWVSPAMSQIYTELQRLTALGLVTASRSTQGERDVTTYAITDAGQETLNTWMTTTPAGFPVLKHSVLLRVLMSNASDPETVRGMLENYLDELSEAKEDLTRVREALRGRDEPGAAFHYPSIVADWGLSYFASEADNARTAIARLNPLD